MVTTWVLVLPLRPWVQEGWGELVDTSDTKIGRGDVLVVVDMQHFDCKILVRDNWTRCICIKLISHSFV